jgi:triacylglycerol lipase
MTGLDFGPLRDHDTFTPEAAVARQPLTREEDVLAALGVSRRPGRGVAPAAPPRRPRAAAEAAPGFSAESLSAESFDWRTVLSSVLACQLAYSSEGDIRSQVAAWGLGGCQVITGKGTLCIVAAAADTTLVAFRGSANIPNWISNINVLYTTRPYGRVHRGFFFALDEIRGRISDAVSGLGKSRVLVTGHSLGGALAALYAAESAADQSPVWIYTFGQPRTGFGTGYVISLTARFGKRLVRVVNNNDVVPQVPPLPFRHAGRLVQFDADGNVSGDPESLAVAAAGPESDSPPALTFEEFRRLQQQMSEVAEGAQPAMAAEGLLPSISDHHMQAYIDKVMKQI